MSMILGGEMEEGFPWGKVPKKLVSRICKICGKKFEIKLLDMTKFNKYFVEQPDLPEAPGAYTWCCSYKCCNKLIEIEKKGF